jgi:hypothetical protein
MTDTTIAATMLPTLLNHSDEIIAAVTSFYEKHNLRDHQRPSLNSTVFAELWKQDLQPLYRASCDLADTDSEYSLYFMYGVGGMIVMNTLAHVTDSSYAIPAVPFILLLGMIVIMGIIGLQFIFTTKRRPLMAKTEALVQRWLE